jgi:peptidoglycan/xylan/chitin deacetylase (PgdA/CDA1 family)
MENNRYDYSPIIKRKDLKWPNGARVALWVCPNIEYFYIDKPLRGGFGAPHLPDVTGYTLRDYGSRIGIFRLMEVLDKHGVRASVLLNADVCKKQPEIIEEGNKRKWEWLGHGLTNNLALNDYPPEDEQRIIREVTETITLSTGKKPKGWLGPGLIETFDTPDLLAAEGYEYVCDWGCDDQPVPMRVKGGRMIVVPYEQGINDINSFLRRNHTPEQYLRMVCDQFDTLYEEGARGGRVMAIPLHPFIIGFPFRIRYLDKALEHICSHKDVWRATGWEIAEWFYKNYYRDPGRPKS